MIWKIPGTETKKALVRYGLKHRHSNTHGLCLDRPESQASVIISTDEVQDVVLNQWTFKAQCRLKNSSDQSRAQRREVGRRSMTRLRNLTLCHAARVFGKNYMSRHLFSSAVILLGLRHSFCLWDAAHRSQAQGMSKGDLHGTKFACARNFTRHRVCKDFGLLNIPQAQASPYKHFTGH